MPRVLANWVESFEQAFDFLPSPRMFLRWGAIACIAGALERKVWVVTRNMELYPNLYTILVAPPGVGKTVITANVEALWRSLKEHHVAAKSITAAALVDSLRDAKRTKTVIRPTDSLHLEFNALLLSSNELGTLLPDYDKTMMNTLTDIYDGHLFEQRRRSNDINFSIPHPQINILAGCTPAYLHNMLPEGAWDEGFLSRTFIVFSGEGVYRELFGEEETAEADLSRLRSDLRDIADLAGKMAFHPDVKAAISAWDREGGPPKPDHPKLVNYNIRRTAHLLKLCMIACASDAQSKLMIQLEHYQRALDWLIEMEAALPDVFRALGSRGDSKIMEEAWHFLYKIYMSNGKDPIQMHRLVNFISEQAPSYAVIRIVEVMEKSGRIERTITKSGHEGVVPKTFTRH